MSLKLLPAILSVFWLIFLTGCETSGGVRKNTAAPTRSQESAKTQVALGIGYLERGNFEDALSRFERAIEFDPTSYDAYTGLGLLNERISNFKGAEMAYRRAVKIAPKRGSLRNNLGQFLCRHGKYTDAQIEFEEALKDPFYRTPGVAASNAGSCAVMGGDLVKAEQFLRIALEKNPNDISVLMPMTKVMVSRGEFMKARAFVQRYEGSEQADLNEEFFLLAETIEKALGATKEAENYARRRANLFPTRSADASDSEATYENK